MQRHNWIKFAEGISAATKARMSGYRKRDDLLQSSSEVPGESVTIKSLAAGAVEGRSRR